MSSTTERVEFVSIADGPADEVLTPGVDIHVFASADKGARNLFTAWATLLPNSELPMHTHSCGEAMVVVKGGIIVQVEDRRYRLNRLDCMFIPPGIPHSVANVSTVSEAHVHVSFPDGAPDRELVEVSAEPKQHESPPPNASEFLVRYQEAEKYQLAEDTSFCDLFASRLGSSGICGGYGLFPPGTSLPCHTHNYDESISIIEGTALCQVAGRSHTLSDYDTACIPEGIPHRFINNGKDQMAMIWVYAGDEPDREIVSNSLCETGLAIT